MKKTNQQKNNEKEFKKIENEYLKNLDELQPEPGLKNIEAFREKVTSAIETVDEQIQNGNNLKFGILQGNKKLPRTTAIANCGTWFNCSGRVNGFCAICQYCYDKPKEVMFKTVIAARLKNEIVFRASDAETIANDILSQATNKTTILRFNEVGEMRNQEDLEKIISISNLVYWRHPNIRTSYIYTHNIGLNFNVKHENLIINGSSFHRPGIDNVYKTIFPGEPEPENALRCSMNCSRCNYCSTRQDNSEPKLILTPFRK